jgi:dTDP-glucose 4,6-dehydratase
MRTFVTGGCGFIGSNFVRHLLSVRPDIDVVVFDLLTYAGNLANFADLFGDSRLTFVRGDIGDHAAVSAAVLGASAIVNFAAESHVDRSILDSGPFVRTNVVGTQVLLDVALKLGVERFVQVSTDEVYGSLGRAGRFTETSPLAPNSPYSASKAAADLLVRAWVHTYGLPAVVVRSSNAYGPYQFPEKLIPLMIVNAMAGEALPVYGDGLQVRDWVHVLDLSEAILAVLEHGRNGEVYNVGGAHEVPNLEVVRAIVALTNASPSLIRFVTDRPGHDRRYAMDHSRITAELGWRPGRAFQEGLAETVSWYRGNPGWVTAVRSGEYRSYYERQYGVRLAAARVGEV